MSDQGFEVEDDFDDYDEESLSSYDGSSEDDAMDEQDGFCGSYGSPSSLGTSPLPSMSPPPRNWEEIDRQQMFEDFENQPMLFGNTSANNENSDKGQEEGDNSARLPATDRTVPTSASVLTVQPNNNNHPS